MTALSVCVCNMQCVFVSVCGWVCAIAWEREREREREREYACLLSAYQEWIVYWGSGYLCKRGNLNFVYTHTRTHTVNTGESWRLYIYIYTHTHTSTHTNIRYIHVYIHTRHITCEKETAAHVYIHSLFRRRTRGVWTNWRLRSLNTIHIFVYEYHMHVLCMCTH
jgi:hypothetical protein